MVWIVLDIALQPAYVVACEIILEYCCVMYFFFLNTYVRKAQDNMFLMSAVA